MKKTNTYLLSFHAIEECIINGDALTLYITRSSSRSRDLVSLCDEHSVSVKNVKRIPTHINIDSPKFRGYWLETGSEKNTPPDFESWLANHIDMPESLILVLDGVQDPHNLGAILRSADLFAVSAVIIPGRRSAGMNDTVERVSAGASRYVPLFQVSNLSRTVEMLKKDGFWAYGADMSGNSVAEMNFSGKVLLIMGNEQKGISSLIRDKCDFFVKIPTRGHIDSLNVSVATAVLSYEIQKKMGVLS